MERQTLATQIEMEQRIEDNRKESECTLQQMLNQPYVAPCLTYEKKAVLPKETAYIQKAAAMGNRHIRQVQGGPPIKIVRQALDAQNERFKEKISGKDDMIQRQQNVMIKQREQILKL